MAQYTHACPQEPLRKGSETYLAQGILRVSNHLLTSKDFSSQATKNTFYKINPKKSPKTVRTNTGGENDFQVLYLYYLK